MTPRGLVGSVLAQIEEGSTEHIRSDCSLVSPCSDQFECRPQQDAALIEDASCLPIIGYIGYDDALAMDREGSGHRLTLTSTTLPTEHLGQIDECKQLVFNIC